MSNKENNNLSDDNIFSQLVKEAEQEGEKLETVRDIQYYLKLISNIFGYLNLFIVFVIGILVFYNYIQNNDYKFNKEFIKSNCSIFLGKNVELENNECMSVTNALKKYENKIKDLEKKQSEKLIIILPKVKKIQELTYSDNIAFLLKKSNDRLKPLKILTEFEKLRYNFLGTNKDQISCKNIEIKDNILKASCRAYSADFDNDIPGVDFKNKISGTSATIAASFLNYIDKKSDNFKNINKQKKFKIIKIDNLGFTKKTDFKIELEYNPNINLSL